VSEETQGPESETLILEHAEDTPEARASTIVLEQLLAAVSETSDVESAAGRLLDIVVPLLDLSRASMALLTQREGVLWLDPVAAAGEHAFLAKDMPSLPLDSSSDALLAVETRKAVLVGDVHGVGERPSDAESGVGRWRAGLNAQSYAVLPLLLRNRVVGTLTVEWATPHPFDTHDRETLEWCAASVAAAVGAFESRQRPQVASSSHSTHEAPDDPGALPGPPDVISLAVFPDGRIVTAAGHPGTSDARLSLTIALARASHDRSAPFWDLVTTEGASTLIIGVASSPAGGAAAYAERCRQILRGGALAGTEPAESLKLLSGWMSGAGQAGSGFSAGIVELDMRNGSLIAAPHGAATFSILGADGRLVLVEGGAHGAADPTALEPAARPYLALEGDGIALTACGTRLPDVLPGAGALEDLHVEALKSAGDAGAARLAELHRVGPDSAASGVIRVLRSGSSL
jgi:hypothetical protein